MVRREPPDERNNHKERGRRRGHKPRLCLPESEMLRKRMRLRISDAVDVRYDHQRQAHDNRDEADGQCAAGPHACQTPAHLSVRHGQQTVAISPWGGGAQTTPNLQVLWKKL